MSKTSLRHFSLQRRMALIFLSLLTLIVLVTVLFVWRATYNHSTEQLQSHVRTSASVVAEKISNTASVLRSNLIILAKDFSIKQLIATAADDKKSLYSAMENFQARSLADIFWVLDADYVPLVSSQDNSVMDENALSELRQSGLHWYQHGGQFYLLEAVALKFVESSVQNNAWLIMGIRADRLFDQKLVSLTDMQISVYHPDTATILTSTFAPQLATELGSHTIVIAPTLHELTLADENYIYGSSQLGRWGESPVYTLLATQETKAYLSTQSLIEQLVIILSVAGVLALISAIVMSRTITRPLEDLIAIARKISLGKYVQQFPQSNTKEVVTLTAAINDMQNGIIEREKEINHLAFFDELTGLPNRIQFHQHITRSIEQNIAAKLIVLTMDVDRFKEINDTISHEKGDHLLQMIAQRLKTYTGTKAFFARLGGDEFGIIIEALNEEGRKADPEAIAQAVVALFEQPFAVDGLNLDIDVSIGLAVYPEHAINEQGLLQCADIAMYSCKDQHYRYALYQPELNKHSVMRLSLMSELKGALVAGQLQLYYQPKLAIADNKITTAECLIRWIHPQHGFIAPDDFIPLAEQTGAIRHVTHWALNTACMQLKNWQSQNITLSLAVNISAMDLVDMQLPAYIAKLLSKYDLAADLLTLEVTESAVMGNPENALKALHTLRSMGVILSIDDFGTGFSSMAQLKKMPVHELKIDKAFVLDLANNKDDQIMVKTLVSLAQNLSLQTVAEGVEDLATLEFLQSINCTKAQGYYLSKALPAAQFETWYHNFHRVEA
ncbi:putative bifunctional diguanylate cyclase/phosphodiesterase [Paraglaciecola hydrolytica]|nr:EAL domain-containing protein [Paraglaciecola hydrolytica]